MKVLTITLTMSTLLLPSGPVDSKATYVIYMCRGLHSVPSLKLSFICCSPKMSQGQRV